MIIVATVALLLAMVRGAGSGDHILAILCVFGLMIFGPLLLGAISVWTIQALGFGQVEEPRPPRETRTDLTD